MSVYVDHAKNQFGRMLMCHLVADDVVELHAFARRLGLQREWFQNKGRFPHYDISQSKRALAVKLGAVEITNRQLVDLMHGKGVNVVQEPEQKELPL